MQAYPDRAHETGRVLVNRDGVVPLGREGQDDYRDSGAWLQRRGLSSTCVGAVSGVVLFLRGDITTKVILERAHYTCQGGRVLSRLLSVSRENQRRERNT